MHFASVTVVVAYSKFSSTYRKFINYSTFLLFFQSYTSDNFAPKSSLHLQPSFNGPHYEFENDLPQREYDHGFHSYQHEEQQLPQYAEGNSDDPYYQDQFDHGYPSAPPMLGYDSQPHSFSSKNYSIPYHVST